MGSRNPTTLGMVEFQLEDVFLVIFTLNMDRKPNMVEPFILGPSMARMALKGGKTKNGGISDDNDNARVTHRLVQGDLYGDVRAKESQLLPSSPESGLHLSRPDSAAMNATRSVQTTLHSTHTRTLSRCARSHARCDHTFGSRA